ncbi:MAG: hypothetical protein JWO38_7628 [Gemmataceae bacterium]|nr:hypothetical protein [Gemmataceae bacterium]
MWRVLQLERYWVPVQIVVLLGVVAGALAYNQLAYSRLPQPVRELVQTTIPDAQYVTHRVETSDGRTVHEVTVRQQGQHFDITVGPDGELVEVEKAIPERDLPRAVADAVAAGSPGGRIQGAEEVRKGDGRVGYEVRVALTGGSAVKARYTPVGTLLRKKELR